MTQFPDLFAALNAPFEDREVRSRSQGGRQLSYITARTAMNRLDAVLGPENWWDEYLPGEHSVICRLTVRLPDGSTLTKCDAGGYAGMADQGDDDKSGFSDSFKRAAVKFGVGRYLYRDGVPAFAPARVEAAEPAGPAPTMIVPAAPPAAPAPPPRAADPKPAAAPAPASGQQQRTGPPRTGRALFAWVKDQETTHEVGLLKYLNNWAKRQEYPGRMVDWDHDEVAAGYAEATRKLDSLSRQAAEEYEEALAN